MPAEETTFVREHLLFPSERGRCQSKTRVARRGRGRARPASVESTGSYNCRQDKKAAHFHVASERINNFFRIPKRHTRPRPRALFIIVGRTMCVCPASAQHEYMRNRWDDDKGLPIQGSRRTRSNHSNLERVSQRLHAHTATAKWPREGLAFCGQTVRPTSDNLRHTNKRLS